MLLGAAIAMTGNLILMIKNQDLFFIGLATSLIGSGLYKCNATQLVGALYKDDASNKEKGFTLLYLAINIGGTLSPLLYGFMIYQFHNWSLGFLCSALGTATSLTLFLTNMRLWPSKADQHPKLLKGYFFILLGLIALCFMLSSFHLLVTLPLVVFFGGLSYLINMIYKLGPIERRPLFALLALNFFAMFYFAAGMQIGTTVTLFIQGAIQSKLPASTFSMLYSGFVLLLAPFFNYLWVALKKRGQGPSVSVKCFIGILLASTGMLAFACATKANCVLLYIIIGYLLLSAGELVITPAVYTAISNNTPQSLKSAMMGCWFLFIGFGSYLSAYLSKIALSFSNRFFTASVYFGQFLFIAGFTFVMALILLLFYRNIESLFCNTHRND